MAHQVTTLPEAERRRVADVIVGCLDELSAAEVERHWRWRESKLLVIWEFPDDSRERYRLHHLVPCLRLLAEGIRRADDDLLTIWQRERMRFVPGTARHEELLDHQAGDRAALTSALSGVGDQARAQVGALFDLPDEPTQTFQLALVGDCVLSEIAPFVTGVREGWVRLHHVYISSAPGAPHLTGPLSEEVRNADGVALTPFTFRGYDAYERLRSSGGRDDEDACFELVVRLLDDIAGASDVPVLLHGVSGLPLRRRERLLRLPRPRPVARTQALDERLRELAAGREHVTFLDERSTVAALGGPYTACAALVPPSISAQAIFHQSAFGKGLARQYDAWIAQQHVGTPTGS